MIQEFCLFIFIHRTGSVPVLYRYRTSACMPVAASEAGHDGIRAKCKEFIDLEYPPGILKFMCVRLYHETRDTVGAQIVGGDEIAMIVDETADETVDQTLRLACDTSKYSII